MDAKKERQLAAYVARRIMSGQIQYRQFLDEFPLDSQDPDVGHLHDLIEHEPKKGGTFGVSRTKHNKYIAQIEAAIAKLEQ